jgi:hypothetical protein
MDANNLGGDAPPVNPSGGRGWLDDWMVYAKSRATMTDEIMIEAVGLWLLATVVARRAVLEELDMPRVYPNLYVLLNAPTTYYHKSTILRIAEGMVGAVAPHLLLPSQMTPEIMMAKLAGQMAINLDSLPAVVQQQERDGVAFAGVRAVVGEEAHKLVARDYLAPIRDIWLEVFDNPDFMSKEFVKNGRVVVHHPSLSLLLATTPVNSRVIFEDGDTGLFSRFAIITPESDRIMRVPNKRVRDGGFVDGSMVVAGLREVYRMLPMPSATSFETAEVTIADDALALYNQYADWLHEQCSPNGSLNDKLRGTYGRMGMMGLKVAMLLALGDGRWCVSADDWGHAQVICERWRKSAHRARNMMVQSTDLQCERDIIRYLTGCEKPQTVVQIHHRVGGDRRVVERTLMALKDGGSVVISDGDGKKTYEYKPLAIAREIYKWDDKYLIPHEISVRYGSSTVELFDEVMRIVKVLRESDKDGE